MSSTTTDEGTLQQLRDLEQEAETLPLISDPLPVTDLLPSYENNSGSFVQGINYLAARFSQMRKVRGDGNCFYRALLFSYVEALLGLLNGGEEERHEGLREQQRCNMNDLHVLLRADILEANECWLSLVVYIVSVGSLDLCKPPRGSWCRRGETIAS